MSARAEQKERSHESILESAARLVREKGISGAGVAEVMKGAALTVGGFYAHFASKDALVDETLRRTGAGLRERLFARIEEKPEADRAEVLLKRYLSADHRDAGALGCPLPAAVGGAGTPRGRGKPGKGALSRIHPQELFAQLLVALVRRNGFDPARVDDVIAGCVSQVDEQGSNLARNAVLAAGWPIEVSATTINRFCGSRLQAVHFAALGTGSGAQDLVVAGGVEG